MAGVREEGGRGEACLSEEIASKLRPEEPGRSWPYKAGRRGVANGKELETKISQSQRATNKRPGY